MAVMTAEQRVAQAAISTFSSQQRTQGIERVTWVPKDQSGAEASSDWPTAKY